MAKRGPSLFAGGKKKGSYSQNFLKHSIAKKEKTTMKRTGEGAEVKKNKHDQLKMSKESACR